MREKYKGKNRINETIKVHIESNLKYYAIVTVLFIIGIIIGIIWLNNINNEQENNLCSYINNGIDNLKTSDNIEYSSLLKKSLYNNLSLTVILWILGCTVIGIPIVYGIILVKGISLGFTISCIYAIFGNLKGFLVAVSSTLLHNIIIIPGMLAISVSGIKLYKSIMKNKGKENIKLEILRHTFFSLFILIFMVLSSFIETYISSNILASLVKIMW